MLPPTAPLPILPETTFATPLTSALDAFKLAAAVRVSSVLDISLEQAWDGVESGKVGKNVVGDFTVAIPRFRLKGDPKAMAQKIVDAVSCPTFQHERQVRRDKGKKDETGLYLMSRDAGRCNHGAVMLMGEM